MAIVAAFSIPLFMIMKVKKDFSENISNAISFLKRIELNLNAGRKKTDHISGLLGFEKASALELKKIIKVIIIEINEKCKYLGIILDHKRLYESS